MYDNIFIIGCDGMIGKYLLQSYKKIGYNCLMTSRRVKSSIHNNYFLDLYYIDSINNLCIENTNNSLAVLSSAITSIDTCEKDYNYAKKINLDNSLYLLKKFYEKGWDIVILSSNLIYSNCIYGKLKLELENKVTELMPKSYCFRMTKILSPKFALFKKWMSDLLQNKPIYAFDDYYFSPVLIEQVINTFSKIFSLKKYGIWNISAPDQISYYEAAKFIAENLEVSQKQIYCNHISEYNKLFQNVHNIYLDTIQTERITQFSYYNSKTCLNIFCNIQNQRRKYYEYN